MFNERAFLIRSLAAVFAIQIAVIGYDSFTCRNKLSSDPKLLDYCSKVLSNYMESNRSVANVFLALLVPAATIGASKISKLGNKNRDVLKDLKSDLKDSEG